jgi:hypothetical protein
MSITEPVVVTPEWQLHTEDIFQSAKPRTDERSVTHTKDDIYEMRIAVPRNQEHVSRRSIAVEEHVLDLAHRSPTAREILIELVNPLSI